MQEDKKINVKELEEKVTALEKDNEELKLKITEIESNWKRALADYRNFQKRIDDEKQSFVEFANSSLILRILSILDNLELLNQHIDDIGLKMIVKEMKTVLTDEGLKEVEALEKDFDASLMDAVDTSEGEKNKVMSVTGKGYFLKDKLIRPAKVIVGNGHKKEEK